MWVYPYIGREVYHSMRVYPDRWVYPCILPAMVTQQQTSSHFVHGFGFAVGDCSTSAQVLNEHAGPRVRASVVSFVAAAFRAGIGLV